MTVEVKRDQRNFQIAFIKSDEGDDFEIRQASAMDDTERGKNHPGSSYVWINNTLVPRDDVRDMINLLNRWLYTGNLTVWDGYE